MGIVPKSIATTFLTQYSTWFGLALFALPDKMMQMYQVDIPSGAKNQRMLMGIVAHFGFTTMWFGSLVRSGTKYKNSSAEGVAGFGAFVLGALQIFFGVTKDIPFAQKVGMPISGIYFNLAISGFMLLCGYSMWSEAGMAMPNFMNCLKFGSLREAAISYTAIIHGFFGFMMVFAPGMMEEQYMKAEYSADTMQWIYQLMCGWGQIMISTSLMHCCFNGISDDDSKNRVCRDIWVNSGVQLGIWIVWRIVYVAEGNVDDAQSMLVNMCITFVGLMLGGYAYAGASDKMKSN